MKKSFAVKNLSKTIIISNEVLPTLGEAKIDFKNLCHPELVSGSHKELSPHPSPLLNEERECKQAAFTLAETMVTLTVLGIVAAITIPALVNRHVEAERRTKLRKAMSVYDAALNKMVIENGIKSDTALVDWADSNTKNDCANTSAYFKTARTLEVNGNATNCKFRAPDGVFWDISDIQKPLIALREDDLNDATADSDTNRAFYMYGWFDEQGSLRSNDLGKINAGDKADLAKLYDFIAGKTKTSLGGVNTNEEEVVETPKTGVNNPTYQAYVKGELAECNGYGDTTSCYYGVPGQFAVVKPLYDENSVRIGDYLISEYTSGYSYYVGLSNYDYIEYERDENGNVKKYNLYKDGELKVSYNSFQELSDSESSGYGNNGLFYAGTNSDGVLRYTCYAKGTQITLADGTTKNVEDITFEDELMVWDFDNGCLASAKPLFIKVPEIAEQYNLLTFSDGRILKTINQHRIFNKEAGKYTYPMTDDTPIGTTTLLDDGSEVTLVKKEIINEPVEYYNIITRYHINCFASGISTSCRLNNLYPIKDYKFVKEERVLTPYDKFHDVPKEWYDDLRLAEQSQEINKGNDVVFDNSLNDYVLRLIRTNSRQMATV